MPRRRDPNKPIKQRTRLDSVKEINREIKRIYRRLANKEITDTAAAKRIAVLVALRNGMPESVEKPRSSGGATMINVLSVPHDCFLTGEQIRAHQDGRRIVDIDRCEPFALATETEIDNIIPMHATRALPYIEPPLPETPPQPTERELIMQQARALGYTPLPPRPRQDD